MTIQTLLFTSIVATAAPLALAGDKTPDTYSGGYALAVVPEEFVLAGAIPLGANFNFPGNPATPVVNGGVFPAYDPNPTSVRRRIHAGHLAGQWRWNLLRRIRSLHGRRLTLRHRGNEHVGAGPPADFREATDFVIDLGNGYNLPAFPVDGANICGDEGNIFIDVEYYFIRLDGSENREFGDTIGPYIRPEGFTFAWGYDIDDARTFNRAGFVATFAAVSCESDGCFGDLNEDGEVNAADIGLLLSAWGSCGKAGPGCFGDLNEDGEVNGTDIGLILGAWGICP